MEFAYKQPVTVHLQIFSPSFPHIPVTGATIVWKAAKNGGPFVTITPTAEAETTPGWYTATFAASLADTPGVLTVLADEDGSQGVVQGAVVDRAMAANAQRDLLVGPSLGPDAFTNAAYGAAVDLSTTAGLGFVILTHHTTTAPSAITLTVQEAPSASTPDGDWVTNAMTPIAMPVGSRVTVVRPFTRTQAFCRARLIGPSGLASKVSAVVGAAYATNALAAAVADAVATRPNPLVDAAGANTPDRVGRVFDAVFAGKTVRYQEDVRAVDFARLRTADIEQAVITIRETAPGVWTTTLRDWGN